MVFKQIAGLIARRIVFNKKPGDRVATGERVGLIKFGSRVDVLFGPEWEIVVQPGMRVAARFQRHRAPPRLEERWRMGLRDRLIDPRSPDRRPRRAAYALPTLFTAGNIFLGYLSILRSFQGAMLAAAGGPPARPEHFAIAAEAIGAAVLLDGLDGRIARMTNTTSDFGREMDSLADVISFGIAPAVLAFAWGVQFVDTSIAESIRSQLFNAGYFIAFLFLLCGAARLARFNVQKNPIPKNPGRPDRKYFVGLPIPAGGRHGGGGGLRLRRRAARLVAALRGLAGAAGCCWAS